MYHSEKKFSTAIKTIKKISIEGKLHESYALLPAHLLLSLYFVHANEKMGKYSLAQFMGVKPSQARKIITLLAIYKILVTKRGRKGSSLTKKGKKLCNSIFSVIIIYTNSQDRLELGALTLGTIDFLLSIPLVYVIDDIKTIEIRDTAMKIGALGATVFRSFISQQQLRITFYEQPVDRIPDNEMLIIEFSQLELFLSETLLSSVSKEHLLIAISTNPLPHYFFNPLFDSNTVSPHHINQLACLQALLNIIKT